MSRGRAPKKACKEAWGIAARRGAVLEAAGIGRTRIDFILFARQQVVFIRVKRSHSRIRSLQELFVLFSEEIAGLRTVPLTAVVSRELWVLLPWGTWQYFRMGDDRILEIPEWRGKVTGTEGNAAVIEDPKDPSESVKGISTGENTGGGQDPSESRPGTGKGENTGGVRDPGDPSESGVGTGPRHNGSEVQDTRDPVLAVLSDVEHPPMGGDSSARR